MTAPMLPTRAERDRQRRRLEAIGFEAMDPVEALCLRLLDWADAQEHRAASMASELAEALGRDRSNPWEALIEQAKVARQDRPAADVLRALARHAAERFGGPGLSAGEIVAAAVGEAVKPSEPARSALRRLVDWFDGQGNDLGVRMAAARAAEMRLGGRANGPEHLVGFGVFQVKPRKRGIGRNPRTGKEVRIPPGRTIRFKPGKDLQNIGG